MRHARMPYEEAEIWPSKQMVLLAQTCAVSRWLKQGTCQTWLDIKKMQPIKESLDNTMLWGRQNGQGIVREPPASHQLN